MQPGRRTSMMSREISNKVRADLVARGLMDKSMASSSKEITLKQKSGNNDMENLISLSASGFVWSQVTADTFPGLLSYQVSACLHKGLLNQDEFINNVILNIDPVHRVVSWYYKEEQLATISWVDLVEVNNGTPKHDFDLDRSFTVHSMGLSIVNHCNTEFETEEMTSILRQILKSKWNGQNEKLLIIHRAEVEKRGKTGLFWKSCLLVCVRGKLLVYRDPVKSKVPQYALTLACTSIDRHEKDDSCFVIDLPDAQKQVFRTSSEQDAQVWFKAFVEAKLRVGKQPTVPAKPLSRSLPPAEPAQELFSQPPAAISSSFTSDASEIPAPRPGSIMVPSVHRTRGPPPLPASVQAAIAASASNSVDATSASSAPSFAGISMALTAISALKKRSDRSSISATSHPETETEADAGTEAIRSMSKQDSEDFADQSVNKFLKHLQQRHANKQQQQQHQQQQQDVQVVPSIASALVPVSPSMTAPISAPISAPSVPASAALRRTSQLPSIQEDDEYMPAPRSVGSLLTAPRQQPSAVHSRMDSYGIIPPPPAIPAFPLPRRASSASNIANIITNPNVNNTSIASSFAVPPPPSTSRPSFAQADYAPPSVGAIPVVNDMVRFNIMNQHNLPLGFVKASRSTNNLAELRLLMVEELDNLSSDFTFISLGAPVSKRQELRLMLAEAFPDNTVSIRLEQPTATAPSNSLPISSPSSVVSSSNYTVAPSISRRASTLLAAVQASQLHTAPSNSSANLSNTETDLVIALESSNEKIGLISISPDVTLAELRQKINDELDNPPSSEFLFVVGSSPISRKQENVRKAWKYLPELQIRVIAA